jgi:glycosyltransferase involved in cell wall biosynthesis
MMEKQFEKDFIALFRSSALHNMKICLVGRANLRFMPYRHCYEDVLQEAGISYDLLCWERLNLGEENENAIVFRRPTAVRRDAILMGYAAYRRFLLHYLHSRAYNMYVILGAQVGVMLYDFLRPRAFILDIRDYSHEGLLPYRLMLGSLLKRAQLVCISSEGFRQWLPPDRDYLLSPNLSLKRVESASRPFDDQTKIISYIGAWFIFDANVKFIHAASAIQNVEFRYIGEGPGDRELESYCTARRLQNVHFYGRFAPSEKKAFYSETNFVLACYGNDNPLVKTLLPNRLYESCMYYRPIIVNTGTYLAEVVQENNLGIVVKLGDMSDLAKRWGDTMIRSTTPVMLRVATVIFDR